MSIDLKAGIVRILKPDGTTAGTGFVVRDDGLIATCAHVVELCNAGPDDQVRIVFHANEQERQAEVLSACWRPLAGDDVAVLRLLPVGEPLPEGVRALKLGTARHCNGHGMQTLGFPRLPGGYDVVWAEGKLRGVVPHPNKQPMLQMDARPIQRGMSGAPVLDLITCRVVGVVSEYLVDSPLKWATTSETLHDICPVLLLHPPQAVEDYLAALAQFCRDLPYVSLRRDVPLEAVYVRQQMHKKRDEKQRADIKGKTAERKREAERLPARPMSINEALKHYPHILIVGGPGTGKSTLLRHLVQRLAESASYTYLPILVSLRGLAEREGDLATVLRAQITAELGKRLPAPLPENFLEDWAKQTEVAWLITLDGLDETVDADRRYTLIRELRQTAWPTGSRLIVTTRPDNRASFPEDITPFDLLPFERPQVETFAHNWFRGDETLARAFLESLETARLGDLSSNPLLLTVAATVFEEEARKKPAGKASGMIAFRRSRLYDEFVRILLAEEAAPNRQMRGQFRASFRVDLGERLFDYRREVLGCIALALQEGRNVGHALKEFLQDVLGWSPYDAAKKARDVLDILAQQRTGLVTRRGDTYDFIHPTFREYLAAWAIVEAVGGDLKQVWQRAVRWWWEEDWREVALFALGVLSDDGEDVSSLVERVRQSRKRGTRRLGSEKDGLFLAVEAIAEQVYVTEASAGRVLDDLLALARDRQVWELLRVEAVAALYKLGHVDEAAAMVRALVNVEGMVQIVVGWLCEVGREDLLALARDEQVNEEVRERVAYELCDECGQTDEAIPILLALTLDESVEAEVRLAAASGVDEFGQADQATQAWRALTHGERVTPRVRERAAFSLLKREEPDDLLSLALDEKVHGWYRGQAVETLGRLMRMDELRVVAYGEKVTGWFRARATETLSKLGQVDEAAQAWQVLARSEKVDAWVRVRAAKALEKLGCASEAAQAWLVLAQDNEAAQDFLAVGRDGQASSFTRRQATEVLWKLGRTDELLVLGRDKEGDVEVRKQAAEALGDLGQVNEAVPILLALARDDKLEGWKRVGPVEVLGKLGQTDDLLGLASDDKVDVWVRINAAQAVRELGQTDEAISILLTLARDERVDELRRLQAAEALGQLGQADEAIPILLALACDEKVREWVRQRAIRALGQFSDARILPDLEHVAQKDQRQEVRQAAREAIEGICQPMEDDHTT